MGVAIRDVLSHLKIPPETSVAAVVNGTHRDLSHALSGGDVLSVFSMSAFAPPPPEPPSE